VLDRVAFASFERFAVLAAAAGVTERVRPATMIAIGLLRPTGLLAKHDEPVDQRCGGRLTLGLTVWGTAVQLGEGRYLDRPRRSPVRVRPAPSL
jgi:alkanesulfonate monooxygenase SsuD/methylene tetrahydromethanopterin reductase-like flavin-dependent oxidoreductase (luciferase family)